MILIISEASDWSTVDVIRWLNYMNVPWARINMEDDVVLGELDINNESFTLILNDGTRVQYSDITAVWYRRGNIRFPMQIHLNLEPVEESYKSDINTFLLAEANIIYEYIYQQLRKKRCIGSFEKRRVNKLIVLHHAKSLGINIPNTKVITEQSDTTKIQGDKYITKAINEVLSTSVNEAAVITYTKILSELSNRKSFFPSLIQNKIEKEADIRSFYIKGKFYSMAIMSQNNHQTEIDFRKYDNQKPNRKVPFKLPEGLESKLDMLMKKIGLETGSIDLILTPTGEFYFLEVNPVGQFGMTSIPCNYNLEKLVATHLMNF